jgi:hypothetical protein
MEEMKGLQAAHHVLVDVDDVLLDLGLDVLGAVRVLERVQRLLELERSIRFMIKIRSVER